MLFSSNFILNKAPHASQFTIYPYLHTAVNNYSVYDQVRSVSFPGKLFFLKILKNTKIHLISDINISQVNVHNGFSMVGGNFIEIYDTSNQWDCVATCKCIRFAFSYIKYILFYLKFLGFFIDTTHNVLDYVEKIYQILKPGN